jgi:DNA-binding transcriptional MerR regulator
MATSATGKNLKMYYSIGEVAKMVGVNETLLRYWETQFTQISPKKAGRGIRQYTESDIEQVRRVYHLVKERGLKISSAREVLSKNREGTVQTIEAVRRLREVRAQLAALRTSLASL